MRELSQTYGAIHQWNRRHFERPKKCEQCNERPMKQWALKKGCEHARKRESYLALCGACHVRYDDNPIITEERWNKGKRFVKERDCLKCHKPFQPPKSRYKYCSTSCSNSNAAQVRNKTAPRDESGKFIRLLEDGVIKAEDL